MKPADKGTASAAGQQKLHTITNPATGESRQITQEQWRTDGKSLKQQGFQRPDDLPDDGGEDTGGGAVGGTV